MGYRAQPESSRFFETDLEQGTAHGGAVLPFHDLISTRQPQAFQCGNLVSAATGEPSLQGDEEGFNRLGHPCCGGAKKGLLAGCYARLQRYVPLVGAARCEMALYSPISARVSVCVLRGADYPK